MAFLSLEQVRPGMVLASPVMGGQGRVLLRAGVQLTRKHLDALTGLGITRLEIRAPGGAKEATTADTQPAPKARTRRKSPTPPASARPTPRAGRRRIGDKPLDQQPDPVVPAQAQEVMQTLEVRLPPTRSLRTRIAEDAVVAQKAHAVSEAIISNMASEAPPSVREVVERTAARTVAREEPAAEAGPEEAAGSSEELTIQNDALKSLIAEHFNTRPDR
ncbi:MAG: hypothetical protein ACQERR_08260 [Pseudomonadota bacterium]